MIAEDGLDVSICIMNTSWNARWYTSETWRRYELDPSSGPALDLGIARTEQLQDTSILPSGYLT